MDPHTKIIPLHLHPMGFIEAFCHFGADLDALLEGTEINKNMFEQKEAKISYAQQKKLLKNGIALCRKPGLGILIGLYMDWSYNGTVGSVVHCAPSLKDAGAALRRYLVVAQPYYQMYVKKPNFYVDAEGMFINPIKDFATNDDPCVLDFEREYRITVTARVWDMCGNKSVPKPGVHLRLNYPEPAHLELYKQIPVESITFGCPEASISAHFGFVTEPWRHFRRNAFQRVMEQCEEEFRQTNIERTYAEKVRWHIYLNYFDTALSLEKIAEVMSLSPRALTRKLANEDTSFRNIHHEVKMEITAYHLASSTLSVDRIAELMGFSSASSLRRAVKNWSGSTAGDLRSGELRGDIEMIEHRRRA